MSTVKRKTFKKKGSGSTYKTCCYSCLATDRKLCLIGQYADLFQNISGISDNITPDQIYLCWECTAELHNMRKFQEKAQLAHKFLRYGNVGIIMLPQCLSKLKKQCIKTEEVLPIIYENELINEDVKLKSIKVEDDSSFAKQLIEFEYVKDNQLDNYDGSKVEDDSSLADRLHGLEYGNDNQSDNYDSSKVKDDLLLANQLKELEYVKDNQSDNYEGSLAGCEDYDEMKQSPKSGNEDVNETIIPNTKKQVCYSNRRYRRLKLEEIRRNFVKKIHITQEHICEWIENERNSKYYKQLHDKCDKCVSKIMIPLSAHNNLCHSKSIGSYYCNYCKRYFGNERELSEHTADHAFIHYCEVCGYRCYSTGHIQRHMRDHDKSFQCKECGAVYNHMRRFNSHYKALHSEFICDHCNKKCRTKAAIVKHMKHHQVHKCNACNVTFKSLRNLVSHNALKHNNSGGEDAFCVRCDKQFNNVRMYKRHLGGSVAHADERRAQKHPEKVCCPECSNTYSRKVYMVNHYRHVHMKQTKYYCVDCNKFYLNRTRFNEHRKYNHEGFVKEKDKLCPVCGRGFAAKRTLENHIRTHSGERPFECMYCDSKFTQKQAMLSHVKFVHLKNKRKTGLI